MKALVTGGGGFLGEYIVKELLRNGHEVRILARGVYPHIEARGVTCFQGNIENRADIELAANGVDAVFHTAARVGVFGRYKDFYRTNVIGTQNVIETCQSLGIVKLIHTSSASVTYSGRDKFNADERDPYPDMFFSAYAQTKAIAEKKVLEANSQKGLLTCALRPHLLFGPGDPYIIPGIIQNGKSGRLRIIGNGKNLTDVTYVENAAAAHLLAATHLRHGSPVCGQAYYTTQGKPVNVWDWVNHILRELGFPEVNRSIPLPIAYGAASLVEGIYRLLRLDKEPPLVRIAVLQLATTHTYSISKAQRDFGYCPVISTDEGLKRTLEHFKNPSLIN